MRDAAPGRVLRLAVIGWGLGHLALGRRSAGLAWLAAEALALVGVAIASVAWIETTWYLLPYFAGAAFIGLWAGQAIGAHRQAVAAQGASGGESGAGFLAWLALPLLLWGTGFWLVAASAGSPAAVLDRFMTAWPDVHAERAAWAEELATEPGTLSPSVRHAGRRLEQLCADGALAADCATASEVLLRNVRVRLVEEEGTHAVALAELVRYERRPTTFLWVLDATELVAVPTERLLRLELEARPAAFGSARWAIVNAEAG